MNIEELQSKVDEYIESIENSGNHISTEVLEMQIYLEQFLLHLSTQDAEKEAECIRLEKILSEYKLTMAERKGQLGLSYPQISKLTGLSLTSVHRIITGFTKNPGIQGARKIAKVLNLDIDRLFLA